MIEGSSGEGSGVVFWSFMVEKTKSCELALRLQVERHNEDDVIIGEESVEEEEL